MPFKTSFVLNGHQFWFTMILCTQTGSAVTGSASSYSLLHGDISLNTLHNKQLTIPTCHQTGIRNF